VYSPRVVGTSKMPGTSSEGRGQSLARSVADKK